MTTTTLKFRPKPWKTALYGLSSLLFTLGGLFMLEEEPVKGWAITSFFGLCALVFIVQLLPGATELKLTAEGFEMTSLFRKNFTRWQDVQAFKVGYLGPTKTILFDYAETHHKHQTGKRIAKQVSGSHGALPSTYGLDATALLQILNTWKKQYGV